MYLIVRMRNKHEQSPGFNVILKIRSNNHERPLFSEGKLRRTEPGIGGAGGEDLGGGKEGELMLRCNI